MWDEVISHWLRSGLSWCQVCCPISHPAGRLTANSEKTPDNLILEIGCLQGQGRVSFQEQHIDCTTAHTLSHHGTEQKKGNTLRLRQNGRHLADIFKCIFFNERVYLDHSFTQICSLWSNKQHISTLAVLMNGHLNVWHWIVKKTLP